MAGFQSSGRTKSHKYHSKDRGMVLWLIRCVTTLLDGLHSNSKQSSTKSSEFHFSTYPGAGHLVRIGTTPLSRERVAYGLAEVPRFSGKFEADLSGDIGAVQEVQRSEPGRW